MATLALEGRGSLQLLFFVALVAAVGLLAAEWLRTHLTGGGKLPPPVLLFLRISLGIVFVILGIIGLILPIVPQTIFFVLALLLLFPQSRLASKACDKIEPKMPRLIGWLRRRGIGIHREEEPKP